MTNPFIDEYGNQLWLNNEKTLHREDGPAYIDTNKTQFWYLTGKCHREDGPAVISSRGGISWYIDGYVYASNKSFQSAAGISYEDMTAMILKYGDVK
jgi:hypothetical protein